MTSLASTPWPRRALQLVAAAAAVVIPLVSPAAAQGDPGGATSTWRVVPEDRAVDVEIVYDRSNDLDRAVLGAVERLPSTAIDISATSARGLALDVTARGASGDFVSWFVAYDREVEPDETFSWTLRYRVPSDPPDAVVHAFVDGALIWVSSFAVDERVAGGPVRHFVELPADYELPRTAGIEVAAVNNGRWTLEATTLDAYVPFVVTAENPAGRSPFVAVDAVGLEAMQLVTLPSDPDWADRRSPSVLELAAALERGFGRPLPVDRVEVIEVLEPMVRHPAVTTLAGRPEAVVLLSAEAPDAEIAHQLAHLWLGDLGVTEPWFVEGVAATMAAAAGRELGLDFVEALPSQADLVPGSEPLADWSPTDRRSATADSVDDRTPLDASYILVASVLDEIGVEAMRDVLEVLRDGSITYPGRPDPEPHPLPADWRTTLDALVEVGGSDIAAGLYARAVIGEERRGELDRWRRARATWVALTSRADTWELPAALRRPMAAWEFDEAAAVAIDVGLVLDNRDEIVLTLAPVELAVPVVMGNRFERTDDDEMDDLASSFADWVVDAGRVSDAARAVDSGHGLLAEVGLLGEDPDADLAGVVSLWDLGSTEAAAADADELVGMIEGATGRGTVRLLVPGLAVVVVVASVVGWRRRRDGDSDPDQLEVGAVRLDEQ